MDSAGLVVFSSSLPKTKLVADKAALGPSGFGPKYPKISSTSWVGSVAHALMDPSLVATIAMLLVMAASSAFSVATSGCVSPCGHKVRSPSGPAGTTVALNTYACATEGGLHPLPATSTLVCPVNGGVPGGFRVSSTRQGDRL